MENFLEKKSNLNFLKTLNDIAESSDYVVEDFVEKRDVLKINYEDCSIRKGAWVIGQKRENGKLVNEGVEVKNFIILNVVYKYYNPLEDGVCQSHFIKSPSETAEGNRFKFNCKFCKYRQIEGDKRCKFQMVIFGLAIVNKELIDCVMYLKGTSFMPVLDFLKSSCKEEVFDGKEKKVFKVPYFSFIVGLNSIEMKNKSVTYFVPEFKKLQYLSEKDLEMIREKVADTEKYIQEWNSKISLSSNSNGNIILNKNEDDDIVINRKSNFKTSILGDESELRSKSRKEEIVFSNDDDSIDIPF